MAKIDLTPIPCYIRGFLFCFLVIFSTYFGTIFLLTPVLPVFYIAPTAARLITDHIIWIWKLYFVSLYEVLFQTKVKAYGNIPNSEASTLLIMNHRTRFDWLYLFSYQLRFGSIRRYTISLKNELKFIPGIGWAMQLAGFIFLDRKWEDDQEKITKCLKVFQKIGYRPQVLLFPEGTDFTKKSKLRSDKFAEKQNLPKYEYVLHPRTTGFCHFVQEMKKHGMLDYVTDITIAYPISIPQNEKDILLGKFPREIHFLTKSFPNNEIPSNKEDLSHWCEERFSKKEATLEQFYEKKTFGNDMTPLDSNESLITSVFAYAWLFWSGAQMFFGFLLYFFPLLWIYVILCTVMYTFISVYTFGLGLFVASRFRI